MAQQKFAPKVKMYRLIAYIQGVVGLSRQTLKGDKRHQKDYVLYSNPWLETYSWCGSDESSEK